MRALVFLAFFFFNDTATTEIYTLSLHDALPIFNPLAQVNAVRQVVNEVVREYDIAPPPELLVVNKTDAATGLGLRSEEHTSELQSQSNLVCRLLLEKKKKDLMSTTTRSCRKYAH